MHRMPYSAKTASHHPVKPYDRQSNFVKRSELMQQSSRVRSHLQILMQKQSASRLHRYLAVKKSIKWYVHQFIVNCAKPQLCLTSRGTQLHFETVSKTISICVSSENFHFHFQILICAVVMWQSSSPHHS